jgi:hypothetical protein
LFVVPYFANCCILCIFENFLFWLVFWIFTIFEKFPFWLVFVLSCQQVWQELNLRPNSPRQDSSLRPHTKQRPPTVHPTTLHSLFPPNHTLPTPPRTHLSHPLPHTHTLNKFFLHPCSPNIPLRVHWHGLSRAANTECESPTLALHQ